MPFLVSLHVALSLMMQRAEVEANLGLTCTTHEHIWVADRSSIADRPIIFV
jgi:hypothetical protein